MAKDTLDIEQTYFIHAPADRVFRAIAEPEGLVRRFLLMNLKSVLQHGHDLRCEQDGR
jgi:uncharacterized protein YndB with AHSA1/START domain